VHFWTCIFEHVHTLCYGRSMCAEGGKDQNTAQNCMIIQPSWHWKHHGARDDNQTIDPCDMKQLWSLHNSGDNWCGGLSVKDDCWLPLRVQSLLHQLRYTIMLNGWGCNWCSPLSNGFQATIIRCQGIFMAFGLWKTGIGRDWAFAMVSCWEKCPSLVFEKFWWFWANHTDSKN
jgi:hypothetical protein